MKTIYSHQHSALIILSLIVAGLLAACDDSATASNGTDQNAAPNATSKPTLTVTTTAPQLQDWPHTLTAGGNIAAWQEAVIGAEISNFRITEINVNVGDRVRKGQVLARIASDTVDSDYAEARANMAEAESTLAEAQANYERAKQLTERGFYSAQQSLQTRTATDTALARLNAAQARFKTAEIRRSKATVLAPDNGIISARSATVGTLTENGKELFRLIRGARLEWRAEVTESELARLKSGQSVLLQNPQGDPVQGRLRAVAPTVDPQTRTALVYVDIPTATADGLRAGMFARGEFQLGNAPALTLPQSAVVLRDGFAYVYRLSGDKVVQTKVGTGRRLNERIEVSDLDPAAQVVVSGAAFLADGDTVRVVAAEPKP